MIAGGGTEGVRVAQQTPEELQNVCVHVWRDKSESNGVIIQECIRCKKERTLSIQ